MGGFQSWVGFGCGLVDFSIGFAIMGNGFVGRCGGMARWRSTWWVSRSVRSAVVGFWVLALWLSVRLTVFLCVCVFFFLGDYRVVVSCGCGC